MKESLKTFDDFIPKTESDHSLDLKVDLLPVISRISQHIPPELVWKLFTSSPSGTAGKTVFPYCRVDASLLQNDDALCWLDTHKEKADFDRWYNRMSSSAFKAVLWVNVGFQGIDNLAKSSESKNWTSDVGHKVNPEEREEKIKNGGNVWYKDTLTKFSSYRISAGVKDDLFTKFNLEHLLEPFGDSR